jgi:ribosomal protein S18 acetylase RimI-like enzyme
MEIVRLTPDDWALFRDLRVAALTDAPAAFGSTLEGEQQLREPDWRAKLATRAQFLAYDALGDGRIQPLGTVGAYRESTVIDLISMWVAPHARRRGVGAALIDRVVRHACEAGCREIRLWVSEGNVAAERLYQRSGFTRTGFVQPIRAGEPRGEAEMMRLV